MAKTQSYWEKRKARELYEELVKAEDTAEEMRQLYIASSNEIKEEAVKLARRFQLRHNLSVKEAERLLARSLDPDDIKNLIMMLKQDPKNAELAAELESQAYASRINRLMAVQSSIDTVANEIYRRSNATTTAVLQDIGQSMYYKQIFEMQQRAGAAFGFTPLDPDRLMGIINRRWSGQNFSERLWTNREQLAAEVKKQLLLGILTGRANRKMAQEIDGRFSVSYNNTRRLVRTEANYVANQLQVESYKDTGVDKYIYVAILDLRTSEICRDLDKKRFLVSNAIVGENYPPMHPWCRSTTIAWMPDQLLKKLQQSAIDPATGETITVPGDMTYREWYDKYVKDNPHKGLVLEDVVAPLEKSAKAIKAEPTVESIDTPTAEPIDTPATESIDTPAAEPIDIRPLSLEYFDEYQQKYLSGAYEEWTEMDKTVAQDAIKTAFENGSFYRSEHPWILDRICETDGLLKNQFETGTSGGALDISLRSDVAEQLFGCSPSIMKSSDFEKYGFLNLADPLKAFERRGAAKGYGAVQIQFRKENLKGRTTYTMGDSLDQIYFRDGIAGSDGDDPTIAGILPAQGAPTDLFTLVQDRDIITNKDLEKIYGARYIELQYHGQLGIDDIESVVYSSTDAVKPETVKVLKDRGVKVYEASENEKFETVYKLL